MKKSTHKRLVAWLLTLALVVTLLPGMGMTALAAEDGGEGNDPPAVEVVASEDESSGTDETVGTPPSTEPQSKEEDKTTEDDGGSSGSDYDIGDDARPQGRMKAPTALAADYPGPTYVSVNGGTDFKADKLYFRNGETQCSANPANYNAHYDPTTGTLTLNGYNGGAIVLGGAVQGDLTIKLMGNNTIHSTTSRHGVAGNTASGSITITADSGSSGGKLTIDVSNSTEYVYGIDGDHRSVTITGSADVIIRTEAKSTEKLCFGINSLATVSILGNASVDIISKVPKNNTGSNLCRGISGNKVAIDTDGKVKIDVTEAGNADADSKGVYTKSSTILTKVGEMQVKWKKGTFPYVGGAISRGDSFNTTTHAVNVDTDACFASYRFGTPRTVTVENGTLTGPGVPKAKYRGEFLEGDPVSIKPNTMTGMSGETIPFKEWTSEEVTFTDPTAENNSFTVPANAVTVTAKHSPFVGTPTFTPTSNLNDRGVLTFTTKVRPDGGNEYFKLLKVGEDSSYIGISPDTTSTSPPYIYSCEATLNPSGMQVPPGDYYVAEYLDGNYYLSEKFTVNYVKPRPEISVSYWPDPTDFGSVEVGYTYTTGRNLTITNKGEADTGELTITVEGKNPDAFTVSKEVINNIPAGGNAVSTVRPKTGLAAGIYTATLKISGDNVNTLSLNVKFTVTLKITPIPRPTANTGLVYNGTERIGVNAGTGYTLTGTYKATDVGATSYTAVATLNSNYKWSDGGTEDVTITWNIGKRDPQPTDIVVTPPKNLVYDGNKKEATAKLDSNYTGAGAITIKYKDPDTGSAADPINAGTYTVYVNVAGGTNFNAATSLNRPGLWNFTIAKAEQNAPVGLGASAPTVSGGKGKINGTMANMQYNTNPDATTSWKNCTAGSTEVDPGTYYVRYKGDNNHDASPNVKVTVPAYGAGVSVSGTALSWNATDDALYYLYPSTMEDAAIKAEWKSGKYTGTACTSKGTPTASGKQFAQTFSFDTVAEGDYKLVIFKPKKYVPKIVPITVGTTDYTCGQLKLWLYGDVNYNGVVDDSDATQVFRYASLKASVFNTGDETTKVERLLAADVNSNNIVDDSDATQIVRYAALKTSIFNTIP